MEVAPLVAPVIVSPSINRWLAVMNNCSSLSTSIVAVALLVAPVIVSPISNLPVVPLPLSKTILLSLFEPNRSVESKTIKLGERVSNRT